VLFILFNYATGGLHDEAIALTMIATDVATISIAKIKQNTLAALFVFFGCCDIALILQVIYFQLFF
jgi:hypothetical protein